MTDPLAKWQATNLRDEMIDALFVGIPAGGERMVAFDKVNAAYIADAILDLLARSDVGRLPDE